MTVMNIAALRRVSLAGAGVLFALFPLLRPWQDKTGELSAAFGDLRWVAAHLCAMVALALLGFGLPGSPQAAQAAPHRVGARTRAWIGAVLVLPYFGAETFGLHAVATATPLSQGQIALIADGVRYAPIPVVMFSAGLIALAAAGVQLLRTSLALGGAHRVGGTLAAAGLITYLPQFFASPVGRIGHGVVLGFGLVLFAAVEARRR